jgi:RHS repeat-associated protein
MVRGGITYRIITDQLGSIVAVLNVATGIVAQEITYDTWGGVLTDTNDGFQPFGFAGGMLDPDTGLVHFGARDYDPETGRWISKEPLGFYGDTSFFVYVYDDPVNWVDYTGTLPDWAEDAGAATLATSIVGWSPAVAPFAFWSYLLLDWDLRDPISGALGADIHSPTYQNTKLGLDVWQIVAGFAFGISKTPGRSTGCGVPKRVIDPNAPAKDVLPGSLKREFPAQHLDSSLNQVRELLKTAKGKEKVALQKAKKLLEQAGRLLEQNKG